MPNDKHTEKVWEDLEFSPERGIHPKDSMRPLAPPLPLCLPGRIPRRVLREVAQNDASSELGFTFWGFGSAGVRYAELHTLVSEITGLGRRQ
jgi:hypothetical protein